MVGMVFMVLFQKTEYTDGLINLMPHWFGAGPVDFISGLYWAKMFVLCFLHDLGRYALFKILILTSAPRFGKSRLLQGGEGGRNLEDENFLEDHSADDFPMIFYLIITGSSARLKPTATQLRCLERI